MENNMEWLQRKEWLVGTMFYENEFQCMEWDMLDVGDILVCQTDDTKIIFLAENSLDDECFVGIDEDGQIQTDLVKECFEDFDGCYHVIGCTNIKL